MSRPSFHLLALALALAACSDTTVPEPVGRVTVEVRDRNRTDIEDANVLLGSATERTDSTGVAKFEGLDLRDYPLTVTAAGYVCPSTGTVTLRQHVEVVDRLVSCRPT